MGKKIELLEEICAYDEGVRYKIFFFQILNNWLNK